MDDDEAAGRSEARSAFGASVSSLEARLCVSALTQPRSLDLK